MIVKCPKCGSDDIRSTTTFSSPPAVEVEAGRAVSFVWNDEDPIDESYSCKSCGWSSGEAITPNWKWHNEDYRFCQKRLDDLGVDQCCMDCERKGRHDCPSAIERMMVEALVQRRSVNPITGKIPTA